METTPVIFDSRHMSGRSYQPTVEAVEESWTAWAQRKRGETGEDLPPTFIDKSYEIHVRKGTAVAYVNDGRWVADCPNPRCNAGIACWPEHDRCCCLECGSIWKSRFPDPEEIQQAEEALAARPRQHRNWYPGRETVEELRHENIEHGYLPNREQEQRLEFAAEIALRTGQPIEQVRAVLAQARDLDSQGRFA